MKPAITLCSRIPDRMHRKKQQQLKRTEFIANPYLLYNELRSSDSFSRVDGMLPNMKWSHVVTRHKTVASLLRDPRMSSEITNTDSWLNPKKARWLPKSFRSVFSSMVMTDAPDHMRLRKLASKAFTPNLIRALEPRIIAITDKLLDDMEQHDIADLVEDFAIQIPLIVISEMLGVPEEDHGEFHQYSIRFVENPPGDLKSIFNVLPNLWRIQRFFDRLIKLKQDGPSDDLTSALIAAEEDGDRLSKQELNGMLFLLLFAGHETTSNLLSSGVLALLENPEQLQKYKDDPSLISPMIEEMLRYTNPVQHALPRVAKESLEVDGNKIKKGETVLLFLAAANRDATIFDNPDAFDISREAHKNFAFGDGVHFCLGAPLARLEATIALQRLIDRFPTMQLAVESSALHWRKSMFLRGLVELPVRLKPSHTLN